MFSRTACLYPIVSKPTAKSLTNLETPWDLRYGQIRFRRAGFGKNHVQKQATHSISCFKLR